jgi:UDP-N-acetylglucosamine 2-epimerase (non-hydrolysing)
MAPTVVHVVGARTHFVEMAPVISALGRRADVVQRGVYTGQHHDAWMSDELLADLECPEPDVFLGAGPGSHGASAIA